MPDFSPTDPDELARVARQHLASLKAAGLEWLPVAPLPPVAPPSLPAAPSPVPAASPVPEAAPLPLPGENLLVAGGADSALSLEQRRQALTVLAAQVAGCGRCSELASTRTQTVFADGLVGAELCLIGEAPGGEEDAQGLPFVGPAGQLLNRILTACGLKREEVYICNILKCRPPGNRPPRPDEAAHCRDYLERQLDLVKPKFICAMGGCAAQNLLDTTQSLGKLRGRFHSYRGIPVLVTYHPAYLLPHRYPDKKKDVWADMKLLMARMGRPIK